MYFEGNNRIYIAGQAWILDEIKPGVEVATSEWATAHMIPNDANSYILGRFVEADRANSNKQYFRLGDLLLAQPTIAHAPLNINHQSSPIGAFVASEMQYPIVDGENPNIEALATFWKSYFPDVYDKVKAAFADGSLFYSMEAVPRTLSTIGGSDDTAEYAYEGRTSPNYPPEINDRSCESIVLNGPHFVGGALIIPPALPGWNRADVKQLSKFMTEQWETAEAMYGDVQELAPELGPNAWETIMAELILLAREDARTFTPQQRKGAAKTGAAMPDGSYPIQNVGDLKNAIRAIGRAKNPAATKAHIRKRAAALGQKNLIPEGW